MELNDAFTNEIEFYVTKFGLTLGKAFLIWFATSILELNEDEALEAISVEGANDKGIDLFHIDDNAGRIFIVQSKHSPTFDHFPKEKDLSSLESSLNWLSNPEALEREGRKELAQASRDYIDARKQGYGVELIFVYTGKKSENIEKKVEVYNQNPENIESNKVCRHFHLEILKSLWDESQGGRKRIESSKLRVVGGTLKVEGKFGKAVLATVPCAQIVNLYNQYGDRLFDRNVRLFLGARKGSVNAAIAKTIKDPDDKGNFWAYNNGITLICDKVEADNNEIVLSNFSIVNGCQTTVSLAENEGTSDELMVLVRCIAVPATIVDDVIRYTNSQNPIRTWDIASQNKTQRRLKTEFAKLKKPYIYVTRRGDKPSGALSRYKDSKGKLRQLAIDEVGQYMAAFNGDPVLAYKNKALIFSSYHDQVFPPDVRAEEILFCWVCGEACRPIVAEKIKNELEASKILKKGGVLFTLAIMSEVLKMRNGSTYISTITEEQADSARLRDRLSKYASYAAMVYIQAISDEMDLKDEELTTLLRQPDAVKRIINRAKRQYEKDALNTAWISGALPKIGKHG